MLESEKLLSLAPSSESENLSGTEVRPDKLTVRVFSFSFHRGAPPRDDAGHGGGFVFDTRSIPNPGREERFKQLTGKDRPVMEYLEQQPSAHEFLGHAASLVDASVGDYQRRGFKNLMVSFGCTGGQHRSVYLAEQLARHLRERNSVNVELRHLELEKMGR
jgi:RNase adaptor protein for sRNA GlmZ degradation